MKTIDLVISIGTGNTAVYQRGRGLVIKEPSAVIITNRGGKMTLVESGRAAVQEAAKLDAKEQLLYPIKDGAIFHERAAVLMYKEFIGRLLPIRFPFYLFLWDSAYGSLQQQQLPVLSPKRT